MAVESVVSAVACAGHLALAILVWLRRDRGSIAMPLSLLFLDAFIWSFADLTFRLTRSPEWRAVDHIFSSFLPVLTAHVIATFVGRSRALEPALRFAYIAAALVAATSMTSAWWKILLALGFSSTAWCVVALVRYRRRVVDPTERARTTLILFTLVFGTLLTSTDLWVDGFPSLPRLSNWGMLLSSALLAAGVLRLRLLGRDVPRALTAATLLAGAVVLGTYLLVVSLLPSRGALWMLATLTLLALALAAWRELSRSAALERERVARLVALGRFSQQLAHDLRNPLAALKGALQFLVVEREQGRSLDEQARFLPLMLEQVERLHRVVESYQRLANVEPERTPTSLNEVVESVLGMQRFASSGPVTVRARLAPDLPECQLDRELLATTLENLLRNAFEAMPAGGTIVVETRRDAPATGVIVSVQDEGPGMDPRVLEHATDQFFTTKTTGSGLGLSFAERVARAHGGRLQLSSTLGRGTTVELWMPASGATPAGDSALPSARS